MFIILKMSLKFPTKNSEKKKKSVSVTPTYTLYARTTIKISRQFLRFHLFVRFVSVRAQEEQYAKWMAACRLAAKGRPLSDYSYESEVKSIKAFLEMQHPSVIQAPVISASSLDIAVEEYVPYRFTKKLKGKVRAIFERNATIIASRERRPFFRKTKKLYVSKICVFESIRPNTTRRLGDPATKVKGDSCLRPNFEVPP